MLSQLIRCQGIASAFQTLAFAAACEIVPKKHRGLTVACISIAAIPGSAFGAVIGTSFVIPLRDSKLKLVPSAYALVATLSWRWTFYISIIANGIAFILIALFYFPPDFKNLHPDGKSRFQQVKELDYLGLLLLGGGLASLLIGISFGDNPHSWTSAPVLTPLILGGKSEQDSCLVLLADGKISSRHCNGSVSRLGNIQPRLDHQIVPT